MPGENLVQFRVESYTGTNTDYGADEWGGAEAQIRYTRPGRPETEWLCLGDEVARRLHRALGAYLAKKARDARV